MIMNYYEVLPADGRYHSNKPLIYSHPGELTDLSVVTVELKNRIITGCVLGQTKQPEFDVKPIKAVISTKPLPNHCLTLANWLSEYYPATVSECLRQFMPTSPIIRKVSEKIPAEIVSQLEWHAQLKAEQLKALAEINENKSTTVLLHGETGSGKTRVYIEMARKSLEAGRSVIILTPEITLTAQLAQVVKAHLNFPVLILHSQLSTAERKKLWLEIINTSKPLIIIGPRSALFTPINNLGLIVVDEAHEPAYKQDQNPRYHAARVASQLGKICGAKVVLGSATPSITDYYLAGSHSAVVEMKSAEDLKTKQIDIKVIDLKDRANFASSQHLSVSLIDEVSKTLSLKKQVMIFLNRRGSSRLILCTACGWQYVCPNCDIPLVYHADKHNTVCHICNFTSRPPVKCPDCANIDLIYRSIGSKSLAEELKKLFPNHKIKRFDGDNLDGERLDQLYREVVSGQIDILVGTQIMAKGLDLPRLGLVGIVAAESSMGLPDFSSEERTFQLLYQVIGRVGRGHGLGKVIIQTYEPDSLVVTSAKTRDWKLFYEHTLKDRQKFTFPPFCYLLQATIRKSSSAAAQRSADKLKRLLLTKKLKVEIVGPAPSFYARRGNNYYYQLVLKSKNRQNLVDLAMCFPADWQINLDPINLL